MLKPFRLDSADRLQTTAQLATFLQLFIALLLIEEVTPQTAYARILIVLIMFSIHVGVLVHSSQTIVHSRLSELVNKAFKTASSNEANQLTDKDMSTAFKDADIDACSTFAKKLSFSQSDDDNVDVAA